MKVLNVQSDDDIVYFKNAESYDYNIFCCKLVL